MKKPKSVLIDKEDFFQDKVTSAASDRLFKAYQEHGEQVFEALAQENPEMFLRIGVQLVPEFFIPVIMDSFRKHGAKALERIRTDNPDEYLEIIDDLSLRKHPAVFAVLRAHLRED